MEENEIRAAVKRLSRPHRSGGAVIERAAILAEGSDSAALMSWISEHAGEAEALAPVPAGRGLFASRMGGGDVADTRPPLRYVLPPGALD